jgi:hypothetical protein
MEQGHTRVSQKVKGLQRKHIYYKYTETKLILLFNVIPLEFNAPVSVFHKFFNSVAFYTNFAPRQWLLHRMKILFLLELLSLGRTQGNLTVNGFTL